MNTHPADGCRNAKRSISTIFRKIKIENCEQSSNEYFIEFVKGLILLSIKIKLLWCRELDCFPLRRPQVEVLSSENEVS